MSDASPGAGYLSVAAMREADRRAIEVLGIPGEVLMDRAGQRVFDEITSGPVVVVCGKGNNGGDGWVVARLSLLAGYATHVISLAEDADLSKDAVTFKKVYTRLGGETLVCTADDALITALDSVPGDATVVDAILGTGTRGEVTGLARTAIDHWPARRTIAVDIPSGLNGDTGEICGNAVRADVTVSFQFGKSGFANPAAAEYLGALRIVDIGIPAVCGDDAAWSALGME